MNPEGADLTLSRAGPARSTARALVHVGAARILAFAGPIGAGKSTLSKALATELGWKRVGFGSAVRDEARRRRLPTTRAALQDLGVQLIVEPGWEPFCRLVLNQAGWQQGEPLLLSGVRHEEALRALQIVVAPSEVALVYIWAPLDVRKERLRSLNPEDAESLEVVERHSTELQVQRNL